MKEHWKLAMTFVISLVFFLLISSALHLTSALSLIFNPGVNGDYEIAEAVLYDIDPSVGAEGNCAQVKVCAGSCIWDGKLGRCGLDENSKCACNTNVA